MCNHCDNGICTNRCAFDEIYPNYNMQLISLETQLAAVRSNIRTAGEYQRFNELLKSFTETPAMILTVRDPSGIKAYMNPQGEEVAKENQARVYFNNRQARHIANVQCAEVEVM